MINSLSLLVNPPINLRETNSPLKYKMSQNAYEYDEHSFVGLLP